MPYATLQNLITKIPSWNVLGARKVTNLTVVGHPAVLDGDVENE